MDLVFGSIGAGCWVLSILVFALGIPIAAFIHGRWGWGLATFFIAPTSILFLFLHWRIARRPFLISLGFFVVSMTLLFLWASLA